MYIHIYIYVNIYIACNAQHGTTPHSAVSCSPSQSVRIYIYIFMCISLYLSVHLSACDASGGGSVLRVAAYIDLHLYVFIHTCTY